MNPLLTKTQPPSVSKPQPVETKHRIDGLDKITDDDIADRIDATYKECLNIVLKDPHSNLQPKAYHDVEFETFCGYLVVFGFHERLKVERLSQIIKKCKVSNLFVDFTTTPSRLIFKFYNGVPVHMKEKQISNLEKKIGSVAREQLTFIADNIKPTILSSLTNVKEIPLACQTRIAIIIRDLIIDFNCKSSLTPIITDYDVEHGKVYMDVMMKNLTKPIDVVMIRGKTWASDSEISMPEKAFIFKIIKDEPSIITTTTTTTTISAGDEGEINQRLGDDHPLKRKKPEV